ncbi:MAG TPA: hypothetical protein VFZ64_17520 [Nocardioidaceae bacterium]
MSTPLSQPRSRVPRFAEAAVERARLTVVPGGVQKAARVPFVTLVSLLLVGGVAGLLLFNTSMQQASFVATSMEQQAAVLAGKEESLRMQLHRMRDPQNLAAEAKRMGMVPADNPAFLRLSDGKVLGRPTVADPTDAVRITPLPPVKPQSLRPQLVIAEVPDAGPRRGEARRDAARSSSTRRDNARRSTRREPGRRAAERRDTAGREASASPARDTDRRTKRSNRDDDTRSAGRTP